MRLTRCSIGWLNSLGAPADDNKKQRLHGEMAGHVTCAPNQFDTNDSSSGSANGPEQRL